MNTVTTNQEYNLLDVVTVKHKRGYFILLSHYGATCFIALRIDTKNIHYGKPIILNKNNIKEVIEIAD